MAAEHNNPRPWFKLPEEDEEILRGLLDKHGIAPILAVLSRFQNPKDRRARGLIAKSDEALARELGLEE